jgi:hypothetical protein
MLEHWNRGSKKERETLNEHEKEIVPSSPLFQHSNLPLFQWWAVPMVSEANQVLPDTKK